MLKKISKESKALILLEFTRALLAHSGYGELAELKQIIKEQELESGIKLGRKITKETIKEIVKEKEKEIKKTEKQIITEEIGKELKEKPIIPVPVTAKPLIKPRVLRIPEPMLPLRLQYLKPTAHPIEIDLGKLNPFIQDPLVRRIECNGPGEKIVVMVPMPRYTDIILNKAEIDEIIRTFEQKSKIPLTEGLYRVAVGRYILSAIISDVIGSKFTISKISYAPIFG